MIGATKMQPALERYAGDMWKELLLYRNGGVGSSIAIRRRDVRTILECSDAEGDGELPYTAVALRGGVTLHVVGPYERVLGYLRGGYRGSYNAYCVKIDKRRERNRRRQMMDDWWETGDAYVRDLLERPQPSNPSAPVPTSRAN